MARKMNWTKMNQQAAMKRYGSEALGGPGSAIAYSGAFGYKHQHSRALKAEGRKFAQKDWMSSDAGRRLQAFVGSRGYRTSTLANSTELIQTAAAMFDIPPVWDLEGMVGAVAALSPGQRRERARAFMAGRDDHQPVTRPFH